ncbi:FAD-dependent oxidoreductase, partial [Mesorhizobium sp. M4B.F.Ca.ET.169.01.1.1]|uniref:FAD-dependent oxidoreductase n=1 Tax=Mesorhizobium sp. M4B.F.Ca.ET.169.01.1.1 TaxID=2563949 RepID=UPI0010940022
EIPTGTTITGIETSGDGVAQVMTDKGAVKGDAYVLALGSYSPLIAKTIGLSLPIYPIKGYSLTIPIGNRPAPPTIAAIDEHNLVAVSRFGDRLRVTATAEFA